MNKSYQWKLYWELARPADYIKNLFVLAPLFFAGEVLIIEKLRLGGVAIIVFCLLSSSCYAINDVLDAQSDRNHPLKKTRPVASGRLKPGFALTAACVWAGIGFAFSLSISLQFLLIGVSYFLLQLLYSFFLKHWPICDVASISMGFILRVIAGGCAVELFVSTWLIGCTGLLTLFLGIGKRLCELTILENPMAHRRVFRYYTPYILEKSLGIIGFLTLASYVSYLIFSENGAMGYHLGLFSTLPLVAAGFYRIFTIFRYDCHGEGIVEIVVRDTFIQRILTAWVCIFFVILYI
ncbi:MAG: UbiA prenyltransferase family protein [Desulfopila sp.]|jgi:4-hydroxybenzoate polyprenyltransferase|nr:UbiA prenyltransferase family protein [Desulfopila sp.]